jgi:hypothetical protein
MPTSASGSEEANLNNDYNSPLLAACQNAFFESYGFIHGCIILNDKELVIQNDSIGGHIHIITSLGTAHGFLCRRHFLANVLSVLVRSYGFVRISWKLLLYRVISRERRVKKGCQGRDLRGSLIVSLYYQMCA